MRAANDSWRVDVTYIVDKNAAYPPAIDDLKAEQTLAEDTGRDVALQRLYMEANLVCPERLLEYLCFTEA